MFCFHTLTDLLGLMSFFSQSCWKQGRGGGVCCAPAAAPVGWSFRAGDANVSRAGDSAGSCRGQQALVARAGGASRAEAFVRESLKNNLGGSAGSRPVGTLCRPPARLGRAPILFCETPLTVRHRRVAVSYATLRAGDPHRVRDSHRLCRDPHLPVAAADVVADGLQPLQD